MARGVRNVEVQSLQTSTEGTVKFDADNKPQVTGDDFDDIAIHTDLDGFSETAAILKFMEEPVTIEIAESTDENAERMVFLSVNGVGPGPLNTPWVPRGQPVTIRRKFVERLCRARPVSIKSVERVNAIGERFIDYPKTSALKYPFSVLEDKNPAGAAWLKKVMAER